ncbi:hypothetical protein KKC45_01255 [Patescibacteria group bacterium]|nr:hypothetical protein [Patescibacteria group bacterium]
MKKSIVFLASLIFFFVTTVSFSFADDVLSLPSQERAKEAVAYLEKNGDPGLAISYFSDKAAYYLAVSAGLRLKIEFLKVRPNKGANETYLIDSYERDRQQLRTSAAEAAYFAGNLAYTRSLVEALYFQKLSVALVNNPKYQQSLKKTQDEIQKRMGLKKS